MTAILRVFMLLGLFAGIGPAQASPEGARAFIKTLGDDTLQAMTQNDSREARVARLEQIFQKGLDLDAIGRLVLGRYWTQATPPQQQAFLDAFRRFVVQTYANLWAEQTVASYSITGVRDVGESAYLVQTMVERPNAPGWNFAWRVREENGSYKVVDVVVDGVSQLVTQRSDFTSVVQRQGLDQLIASLRQRTARG